MVFDQVVAGIGVNSGGGSGLLPVFAPAEVGALSYRATDDSYVFVVPRKLIRPDTEFYGSSVLSPADVDTSSSDATTELRRQGCRPSPTATMYDHRLLLYRQRSASSRVFLTYSAMAGYTSSEFVDPVFAQRDTFFIGFGSQTPSVNIPTNGTIVYRGEAMVSGYLRAPAYYGDTSVVVPATITVDFVARTYRAEIDFTGKIKDFGIFAFDNSASPGLTRLSGTLRGGSALGFLSGPSGEEMVMTFAFTRQTFEAAGSIAVETQYTGSLVARR